ncbi:MAG: carbonic anhydrase [Pseudomonadota bacterium]
MRLCAIASISILILSCWDSRESQAVARDALEAAPAQKEQAHWTYEDQAHWSETSEAAKACAIGTRQSPIELREQALIDEPDLSFNYQSGVGAIFNNGHSIEVAAPQGQGMTTGGEVFTLMQAHFHDPSEHHLGGAAFPLEMHLVHRDAGNRLAVIGVLFREGSENAALARLWEAAPLERGKDNAVAAEFDASAFLPPSRVHFEYEGSLTTPPCTEGVRWFVMRTPMEASAAQIDFLSSQIGKNARAIQSLNARTITEGE